MPPLRWSALIASAWIAGCGGGSSSDSQTSSAPQSNSLSAMAQIGRELFFDPSLSASGQQSCASCHQPSHAFADTPDRVVSPGGPQLQTPGFRNTPSIAYASFTPGFHFNDEGTPVGGFNRDGRAATLAEQARRPFLAPHEMANDSIEAVVAHVRAAAYVNEFMQVFGADIFDDPTRAFDRVTLAIAAFEKEAPELHAFDSKFDGFLAGRVRLNDQELRGLALFNNPSKGNCAACHPSARNADGSPPLFTDFSYDNLGVPRNALIAATNNPAYFDLGLCGPDRSDLSARTELCGSFKVPTLRNVARTAPYFHNGRFQTLEEVVRFYVTRDTNPELWYPVGANGSEKFNDLPESLRANVNTSEAPYNREPGQQPALNDDEIADVVAFLKTLDDGYTGN